MLDAIVDLTKARPHMERARALSTSEIRAYSEGYYTGVIYALRVAQEAIGAFKLARAALRRTARVKRSA